MMNVRYIGAVFVLISSTALLATTQRTRIIWIDHIEMRLLYAYSGTLSEDISKPFEFSAWNTVIGEGEAKEPADDVLVTVHMGSMPTARFEPVTITAKDGNGKILGKRTTTAWAGNGGKATASLMLYGVTCAGTLTVTAKMGQSSMTNTANLPCGE